MTAWEIAGRRVIFVQQSLGLGGAERQALHLARYLKGAGAVVEYWGFSSPDGAATEVCQQFGIPWRYIPVCWAGTRKRLLRDTLSFGRELRRARPDVVLPYTLPANVICGLVWRFTAARTCIWNQRDEGIQRTASLRLEALAARWTPQFVANSTAGAQYLENTFGLKQGKTCIIPNGVKIEASQSSRQEIRSRLGLDDDTFLACMLANLHQNKDHETLLRAWKIYLDSVRYSPRKSCLLLAGRLDNTARALKALAFDLKLCDSVKFLGSVSDVPGLLNAVDIGVFSSISEGCPNGVLEFMAYGLPVAATDITGVREATGADYSEYLAPVRDHAALAAILSRFASDPEVRCKVGSRNRQRILEEFTIENMCQSMVALIV